MWFVLFYFFFVYTFILLYTLLLLDSIFYSFIPAPNREQRKNETTANWIFRFSAVLDCALSDLMLHCINGKPLKVYIYINIIGAFLCARWYDMCCTTILKSHVGAHTVRVESNHRYKFQSFQNGRTLDNQLIECAITYAWTEHLYAICE